MMKVKTVFSLLCSLTSYAGISPRRRRLTFRLTSVKAMIFVIFCVSVRLNVDGYDLCNKNRNMGFRFLRYFADMSIIIVPLGALKMSHKEQQYMLNEYSDESWCKYCVLDTFSLQVPSCVIFLSLSVLH